MSLSKKPIGVYRDGKKIYREDIRLGANLQNANLQGAYLRGATNLRNADLQSANLRCADLVGAELRGVNLRDSQLQGSNLRNADLRNADLSFSDLRCTYLKGANLQGTVLDLSAFPLLCGSFGMKADDRLVYQLICHITRLAQDNLSDDAKKAIEAVMPWADKFCDYRDDVKRLNKEDKKEDED